MINTGSNISGGCSHHLVPMDDCSSVEMLELQKPQSKRPLYLPLEENQRVSVLNSDEFLTPLR